MTPKRLERPNARPDGLARLRLGITAVCPGPGIVGLAESGLGWGSVRQGALPLHGVSLLMRGTREGERDCPDCFRSFDKNIQTRLKLFKPRPRSSFRRNQKLAWGAGWRVGERDCSIMSLASCYHARPDRLARRRVGGGSRYGHRTSAHTMRDTPPSAHTLPVARVQCPSPPEPWAWCGRRASGPFCLPALAAHER